jgi:hypothetical protein
MLKDNGTIDARSLNFFARDAHCAFFVREQAGDDIEESGFAATARADNRQKLSVRDRDGNIGQRDYFPVERLTPVSLGDVLNLQLGHSAYFPKASFALRCSSALMEGPNNCSKKPSLTSLLT